MEKKDMNRRGSSDEVQFMFYVWQVLSLQRNWVAFPLSMCLRKTLFFVCVCPGKEGTTENINIL